MQERQAEQKVVSVAQLNSFISKLIGSNNSIKNFLIRGEISTYKFHAASGNHYFTLKDEQAQVSCVIYASVAASLKFKLDNGQQVICLASAAFYARSGSFQLCINAVKLAGAGELYEQFLALKNKLAAEGLFAAERKRPLPLLPEKKVAVVTSSSGAVIKDIIKVGKSRYPNLNILLFPVLVQGNTAAKTMVDALAKIQERDDISAVIIGRGGGSMEDLWCFNDEALAYAIYNCKVPVVSAVGHESDFTICDFVADVRASTPSNAAEKVFPVKADLIRQISYLHERSIKAMQDKLTLQGLRLAKIGQNIYLQKPQLFVDERYELLDRLKQRLTAALQVPLFKARSSLLTLSAKRKHAFLLKANRAEAAYNNLFTRLSAANPLTTLERGYAYVTDDSGKKVESVKNIRLGTQLALRFRDGNVNCVVENVEQ